MTGAAMLLASCAMLGQAAESTPAELRELVRRSLTGLTRESERKNAYLFRARNERKELDAAGKTLSQRSYVWERVEIGGFTFGRTLERNGKPLTEEERKGEEAAIARRLAELKAPKSASVAPAAASNRRDAQEDWYKEFPEALDYKLAGEEMVNGRPTLHLEAMPRPGYQPKNMRARIFEKMKASMWIDKTTAELARVDAEMFDTVSVGFGVVGKIEKGTRFRLARRPMDGASDWLTESQSIRFGARILLVKSMRNESTTEFSAYRKRSPATTAPAIRP